MSKLSKKESREKRHRRVRKKVSGSPGRGRLCVSRSARHFRAQIVDDSTGASLCFVSTLSADFRQSHDKGGGNIEAARALGELLARKCGEKGITSVVFDRCGYPYHGRIKAFAEGARSGGLVF